MSYFLVYLAGVVLGLVVMRDSWPTRVATALVWPLGPIAFAVVLLVMAVAAVVLWPIQILGAAVVLTALAWLSS